jgi:hypothetical protein
MTSAQIAFAVSIFVAAALMFVLMDFRPADVPRCRAGSTEAQFTDCDVKISERARPCANLQDSSC